MATARHVEEFLTRKGIPYEVIAHSHTATSLQSSKAAHVEACCVAKAVLLEDTENRYLMAVLPAARHLKLGALREQLRRPLGLATEPEVARLFDDCETGAIPAIGSAYGVDTVWDDSIAEQPEIYFEAGDHEHLIRTSTQAYLSLLGDAPHGRFSAPL